MQPMTDDDRKLELNRLEKLARENSKRTHSIYFQGENHYLPVFKVDIEFPLFRMENGRTRRKQLEFVHNFPTRKGDLADPSSAVAQTIQLGILQDMAEEADLLNLLKEGQHEPLLLRHDGYVVNGNRRLAAMRLLRSNPEKYKTSVDFSYVDVARLPHIEEKEIRRIEQRLQMSQDGKADYNWVDELLTIQANIADYGMTVEDLRKDMKKRARTIENQIRMLKLVDLYLEKLDKKSQYFVVQGDEQAFKTLAQGYARYAGDASKQAHLLDVSFAIIVSEQPRASKHLKITTVIGNLEKVVRELRTLEGLEPIPGQPEASDDILDSLASGPTETPLSIPLDAKSADKVLESVRSVEREIGLEDEANGPAEAVAKAAALLKNVRITSAMTLVPKFRGQLKAIKTLCDELLAKTENSTVDIDH